MFALAAILLAPAYVLVLVAACVAPVGYQDETGFHTGREPTSTDALSKDGESPAFSPAWPVPAAS